MAPAQTNTDEPTYEQLCRSLSRLTPREDKILRMRYGIGDEDQYSCEEIAKRFHLTLDDVEKIIQRSLQKLRDSA